MSDLGDGLDIQDVHTRVGDGLGINELGVVLDGLAKVIRIVRLDERRLVAEPSEGDIELRIGAAVQRGGGDEMIAGLQQAADCQELRRLAAGQCQCPDTALKRGDAFFEHRRRRVHDACVDVPESAAAQTVPQRVDCLQRHRKSFDRWEPRGRR